MPLLPWLLSRMPVPGQAPVSRGLKREERERGSERAGAERAGMMVTERARRERKFLSVPDASGDMLKDVPGYII